MNSLGLLSATTSTFTRGVPLPFGQALVLSVIGLVIVILALAFLAVMLLVLNKILPSLTGKKQESPAVTAAPVVQQAAPAVVEEKRAIPAGMAELPANQSQGEINLYSVDDKTAAMIMAIVSDTSKIPLNELYFKSIKEI